MLFILLAAAAMIWSLLALRWSISRRKRPAAAFLAVSILLFLIAFASVASDARDLLALRDARRSDTAIRIVRRGEWWQLDYAAPGVSFTTANELHVPAGSAVRLSWGDASPPMIPGSICLPFSEGCVLVTGAPRQAEAEFVSVHPRIHQRLQIVVEPPRDFDRWMRNEARPAPFDRAGAALFESSGCVYCHVIRGVAASPSQAAPDLTHLAARSTIGAIPLPRTRANLTAWIANSHALNPNSTMPRNAIDPAVLHRLEAYLETLR